MTVTVEAGVRYAELPVAVVHANPAQPRTVFDEDALASLAESIDLHGLLQPVLVTPDDDEPGTYRIIAGERRYRAIVSLGRDSVPALVRTGPVEEALAALAENLHRADLNPLEEGAAYAQLIDADGYTQADLAARLGVSRARVGHAVGLLRLPEAVQRRVAAGVLSFGHARALCAVPDAEVCASLAARVVAEGLSVRALEEIVALTGASSAPRARVAVPRASAGAAQVGEYADVLTDALDTRVKIAGTVKRGRIVVEFAGEDDLARLVGILTGR